MDPQVVEQEESWDIKTGSESELERANISFDARHLTAARLSLLEDLSKGLNTTSGEELG